MALHVDYAVYIEDIPRECVEDCTRPGHDATGPVQHWREVLGFTVDRELAIRCLERYGAWGLEELNASSDADLADKVLWLACGGFSEYITCAEREGVDPYGDRPEDFDPSAGSDLFVLE